MDSLESMLKQFFASVADREKGAAYIRQFPEQYDHLFKLACSPEQDRVHIVAAWILDCLLYTSPSPRDRQKSRMPSSA